MRFRHADAIWSAHPHLTVGALYAAGVDARADTGTRAAVHTERAAARLARAPESEFPEVLAWRRAFSRMGLKPTQYRCASESLLRRLRTKGDLPRIHPVVDLCNAISAAYGVPVAALDADRITGPLLEVRPARGDEHYTAFDGSLEHPAPGEVTFVDSAGRSHARRWTHRQSGHSAVGEHTRRILVVTEAMHDDGGRIMPDLLGTIGGELTAHWPAARTHTAILTASDPEFAFEDRHAAV
ncbi:phenylalanine--tRNA ligase beta subunit-related protein [Streptomyces sp. NPDC006610]|jgi:DNA/RNA-binding domain of Phe-tRNA-synthetase-like protein|uniref:B3/B4 domain-containing protein n=1 Tax=Streptomyces sp. NPDC006610 TaxID=3154584 RepID=UPI0033A71CD6